MIKMSAGTVTREVKRQLRLAGLPEYKVNTRFTQLSERSPSGMLFGWQTFIHELDSEAIEVVELVMGNMPGLIDTSRHFFSPDHPGFLSVVVENLDGGDRG